MNKAIAFVGKHFMRALEGTLGTQAGLAAAGVYGFTILVNLLHGVYVAAGVQNTNVRNVAAGSLALSAVFLFIGWLANRPEPW